MKHHLMQLAGYQHLSYDPKYRLHRLKNLQTGEIELWKLSRVHRYGIIYKNSHLIFLAMEADYKGGTHEDYR